MHAEDTSRSIDLEQSSSARCISGLPKILDKAAKGFLHNWPAAYLSLQCQGSNVLTREEEWAKVEMREWDGCRFSPTIRLHGSSSTGLTSSASSASAALQPLRWECHWRTLVNATCLLLLRAYQRQHQQQNGCVQQKGSGSPLEDRFSFASVHSVDL